MCSHVGFSLWDVLILPIYMQFRFPVCKILEFFLASCLKSWHSPQMDSSYALSGPSHHSGTSRSPAMGRVSACEISAAMGAASDTRQPPQSQCQEHLRTFWFSFVMGTFGNLFSSPVE